MNHEGAPGCLTECFWSTATGKRIATLPGPHDGVVNSVAFSPDGKTLAVIESIGDGNGTICLWSIATHKLDATLTDPLGYDIDAAAFSPDGRLLAAGDNLDAYQPASAPARIYLWDISWLP
jgi:eukaryotic-like serine/threonine-protein kinase